MYLKLVAWNYSMYTSVLSFHLSVNNRNINFITKTITELGILNVNLITIFWCLSSVIIVFKSFVNNSLVKASLH